MKESLDERLAKLEKAFGKPKRKLLISIKGHNRIYVIVGDQPYLVPSWFSRGGNLCWKIEGILYVKKRDGSISKKEDGKWSRAEFVTTKAKAPNSNEEAPAEVQKNLMYKFPDSL